MCMNIYEKQSVKDCFGNNICAYSLLLPMLFSENIMSLSCKYVELSILSFLRTICPKNSNEKIKCSPHTSTTLISIPSILETTGKISNGKERKA